MSLTYYMASLVAYGEESNSKIIREMIRDLAWSHYHFAMFVMAVEGAR